MEKSEFWELIAEAKEHCGKDISAEYDYLKEKLTAMGPETALDFHGYVYACEDQAYQYGLWDAASILTGYCSDDGFTDFRAWLIAQGEETYLEALANPDSLAEVEVYENCRFEGLSYIGNDVYEELTGESAYDKLPKERKDAIRDEIAQEVQLAPGIQYPRDAAAWPHYFPNLSEKYLKPGDIERLGTTWNTNDRSLAELLLAGQRFDRGIDVEKLTEWRLYSPLTADVTITVGYAPGHGSPTEIHAGGKELAFCYQRIAGVVHTATRSLNPDQGLMEFFDGAESIKSKVLSVRPEVELYQGELYAVTACEILEPLTSEERTELTEFLVEQYADGWGAQFQNWNIPIDIGTMNLHFYQDGGIFLKTQEELAADIALEEAPVQILKLYSPLKAELDTEQYSWDYDEESGMTTLDGSDLPRYMDAILQGIEDEEMPEEQERGLMRYYGEDDMVDRKVLSVKPTVELCQGKLYGMAVCEVKGELTQPELETLKDYITGQYSDGWGEGFEQRPRKTVDGDLYVHFWDFGDFYLKTQEEFDRQLQKTKRRDTGAR